VQAVAVLAVGWRPRGFHSSYRAAVLTQGDVDALIFMPKHLRVADALLVHPGVHYHRDVDSDDGAERFILTVNRRSIRLSKFTYQERGRKVVVLYRLDIDGPPHKNPDGKTITGSHLHVWREGYDAKWAFPVDVSVFTDTTNAAQTLGQFCLHCNITGANVQGALP
jgi:hypothetical protein